MTSRRGLRSRPLFWVAVALLALIVAGGSYGIWYLFLRPSGPPPVNIGAVPLPSVTASASGTPSAAASNAGSPTAAAMASASAAATAPASAGGTAAGIDGTWKVDPSLDSFVGYRVQEQLASLGANTAVGRTADVTGSFTITGATVSAAEFSADLTNLKSDDDRRDGQLARQGIQTNQFPTATFKLSTPIDLGSLPADGASIETSATGDFTLHGVTKSVQIKLQAKRSADVIAITGSLTIVWADYGITKPNSFAVLSIEDQGIMELQLLFTRAS